MLKLKFTTIIISLTMAACSSTQQAEQNIFNREAHQLLDDAYIEGVVDEQALIRANHLAALSGDELLQWKTDLALCQHKLDTCKTALTQAHMLQQNKSQALFETYLQIYLSHGDTKALSSAEQYSNTPQQRMLLKAFRGSATAIDDWTLPPNEKAVALLAQGDKEQNLTMLLAAADEFSATQNFRGTADALFIAAKVAIQKEKHTLAKSLALRSKRLLHAVGQETLAARVDDWMKASF